MARSWWDTTHIRVSLADAELPNHVRFTQYVFRMRRSAMTVVLDDPGDRVLLRRHRFIVDRWVWELPGGYVDDGRTRPRRRRGRWRRQAGGLGGCSLCCRASR